VEETKYDIETLIGKVLTREATADEQQKVTDWCTRSTENQKYYDHLKLVFEKSVDASQNYDVDAAWEKVKGQLSKAKTRTLLPSTFWRIAASLVLISVLSYLVFWQFFSVEQTTLTSKENVSTHFLTEGTEVVLNKSSSVEVTWSARKKSGVIKLSGEAMINIRHEEDKTWLVAVEDVFIRDIGTQFNVKAYPENEVIEVSVLAGEVQFYTSFQEGLNLKAGEHGVYSKTTQTFTKTSVSQNVLSYKTLAFTFEDTDLRTAAQELGAVYDQSIHVPEQLNNCRITVNFINEDLATILDILAETLGLQVIQTADGFLFEGETCN
jgi:transmembrane sensor